jgi:hypothetical protein
VGTTQIQTGSDDAQVRSGVVAALAQEGVTVEMNEPGTLVLETGSVGKAYLAGPFRATAKMPMRIQITTVSSGADGSTVTVTVGGYKTGSGFASGGLIGMAKQKKAEKLWMEKIVQTIPGQEPGATPQSFTT